MHTGFALVLCAILVSPQVPRQGGTQQHAANQKTGEAHKDGPAISPAPTQVAPIAKEYEREQQASSSKQEPGYWEQAFAPANAANWALAVVGVIAGGLAWMTLRAINRQARIMANAERPWIIAEVPDLPPEVFLISGATQVPFFLDDPLKVRIANRGKGVCRVLETSIRFVYAGIKGGTPPPDKPPYAEATTHDGLIIAPDVPWEMEAILERADWGAPPLIPAYPGVHFVYVFGYVIYIDGHTDRHTTRFGLIWQIIFDGSGRIILGKNFKPAGPPAYNYAD